MGSTWLEMFAGIAGTVEGGRHRAFDSTADHWQT
jgi:hypothetical protein